ncbi:hypothetical protein DMUE_2007 [Dictyocoela muelleri]|nr:hypothetical protein DMUE_2007 [Dictyocoela muelleri]
MKIKIKNPSYFKKIIKSLPKERFISFTINSNKIMIFSSSIFYFYIIFDDVEISNFSKTIDFNIKTETLSKYLDYFSDIEIIIEDMFRIYKHNLYIEIPFCESSRIAYIPHDFYCRLIFKYSKFKFLYLLKDKCRIIFENNTFTVKKNYSDGYELLELKNDSDIEVVRKGVVNINLDMNCILFLKVFGETIKSIILSFNDDFMLINIIFKNYDKLFYEIQVPRFVIDNYYR